MDPNNQPEQTPQSNDNPSPETTAPEQVPQQSPVEQPNAQENVSPAEASVPQQSQPSPASTGENPGQTLGIIGLVLAFFFAPAAIVLGVISRKKSKEANHSTTLGTTAMVLGIVFTVLGILFAVAYGFIIAAAINSYDGSKSMDSSSSSSLYE